MDSFRPTAAVDGDSLRRMIVTASITSNALTSLESNTLMAVVVLFLLTASVLTTGITIVNGWDLTNVGIRQFADLSTSTCSTVVLATAGDAICIQSAKQNQRCYAMERL